MLSLHTPPACGAGMGAPSHSSKVLRFGVFELAPETQQLRRAGVLLRIQPQPFKVLALLVSRPRELVSREELRRELWGNETFVDFERGLNYCIRQIRAVLGDEAQTPRYIETVPAVVTASSSRWRALRPIRLWKPTLMWLRENLPSCSALGGFSQPLLYSRF
jgi:hypothetical protein